MANFIIKIKIPLTVIISALDLGKLELKIIIYGFLDRSTTEISTNYRPPTKMSVCPLGVDISGTRSLWGCVGLDMSKGWVCPGVVGISGEGYFKERGTHPRHGTLSGE